MTLELHDNPNRVVCRNMEDVNSVILSLVRFNEFQKKLNELMDDCKDAVKTFMKEHEVTSIGTKETYACITKYSVSQFDKKSFEKKHPDLYKEYVTTQSRERFTYGKENNDNA